MTATPIIITLKKPLPATTTTTTTRADKEAIFKLCKRKRLQDFEKKILISAHDLVNGQGENVIHNYMKHDGTDYDLVEKMLKNGHTLNNFNHTTGYSAFHSTLKYAHPSIRIEKARFLLKHNCPLSSPKCEITKFLLDDMIWPHGFPVHFLPHDDDYFCLIKDLTEKSMLKKDLTSFKFNPGFHCQDFKKLKWFDDNFKIDYHAVMPKKSGMCAGVTDRYNHNPLYYMSIHGVIDTPDLKDMLDFLVAKDPNMIKYGLEQDDNILARALTQCMDLTFIETIYRYGVPQQINDSVWKSILEQHSQSPIWDPLFCKCLIWGLENNKINVLPITPPPSVFKTVSGYGKVLLSDISQYKTNEELLRALKQLAI